MKFYDSTLYKTEQRWKIILTILITFIIGFFIGYWCRDFETDKTESQNTRITINQENTNNQFKDTTKK